MQDCLSNYAEESEPFDKELDSSSSSSENETSESDSEYKRCVLRSSESEDDLESF